MTRYQAEKALLQKIQVLASCSHSTTRNKRNFTLISEAHCKFIAKIWQVSCHKEGGGGEDVRDPAASAVERKNLLLV